MEWDSGRMSLLSKDGGDRIWQYRNVLHQAPGMPARVLGDAQDVTESVRAVQALITGLARTFASGRAAARRSTPRPSRGAAPRARRMLQKPFTVLHLLGKVRQVLDGLDG